MNDENLIGLLGETFFKETNTLIFFKDLDFKYQVVSDSYLRNFGFKDKSSVIGKVDSDLYPKEMATLLRKNDKGFLDAHVNVKEYLEKIPYHNEVLFYRTYRYLVKDHNKVIGILSFVQDLSELFKYKEINKNLAEQQEKYDTVLNKTSINIFEYYINEHQLVQSESASLRNKLPTLIENVPQSLFDSGIVPNEYAAITRDVFKSINEGKKFVEGVILINTPGRQDQWYMHAQFTTQFDKDGKPYKAICLTEDVSDQYNLKMAFQDNLNLRFNMSPETLGTIVADANNWSIIKQLYRDKETEENFYAAKADDYIKKALSSMVDSDDTIKFLSSLHLEEILKIIHSGKRHYSLDYKKRLNNGKIVDIHDDIIFQIDPVTGHAIVLFVIKDKNVDVKNIKYQELMQKATLDQMTGLYNHTNTFDKIEKYTKNEGYGLTHALFMIDIDNFKMVNDRLGHAYGDKTIIEVGNTIKNSFRKNDIVGRIGGDEFMILMKDINFEKANAKAQELVDLLQVIAHNEADTVNTSCSVGVFVFKANGSSIEQLYLKTDALLYKSKQSGRNTFTIDTDKDENLLSIEENKTNVDETKGSVLKMKTLFDNLQAGVFMVDVFKDKKTDVFANNGCDAYFAGNPNYLGHTSDGFFNVVYKDDIAALNHFLENDSKKEGRRTFTLRVWKTKDELTWLNLSTKCLENNSERARLLCIVFDVTHLKMAEEKVADENRAMDFALNNVNACIWEYNIKENKTHYRGNVQFKYGLSDELNDPIETLIKRGTIANRSIDDYRLMYDSIESGQDSLTKDIYFVSIDGETIKITITLNAVKDPSGKLVSIVGFGFRSK